MRSMLGQTPERAPVRAAPNGTMPVTDTPTVKEIPYDYVARFILSGQPGNRVPDVINISTDGAFVATAIGYSFIPGLSVRNQIVSVEIPQLGDPDGGEPDPPFFVFNPDFLRLGHLFSPFADELILSDRINSQELERKRRQLEQLIVSPIRSALAWLCGIDFRYSIIDSGSGRELQNRPIHNIAGLGKADGERPFRYLAKPQLFMPRSTIRIEVEEVSGGPLYQGAELFMVFHGYKMLGYGT